MIVVNKIKCDLFNENCYIVYNDASLDAVIIDPGSNFNDIYSFIDRNKLNNHISNLRWVTKIENRNNIDKEAYSKTNSLAQLNSQKKKRVAVRLVNRNENLVFNSRFQAAQWLIENGKTQTKNPKGLSRRIAIQKFVHGYKIYNINAERLG